MEKYTLLKHPILSLIGIAVLLILSPLMITAIAGVVLLVIYAKELSDFTKEVKTVEDYRQKTEDELAIKNKALSKREAEIKNLTASVNEEKLQALKDDILAAESKLQKETKKVEKVSYLFNAIKKYISGFQNSTPNESEIRKIEKFISELEIENLADPTAEVKLRSDDVKELRRKYREIKKEIDLVFEEYEKRYTTKANLAIYRLMEVALRAEFQNVLFTMKFGKLEDAEKQLNDIADKYIKITADGNQSIAPTITRFVQEMRSLFIDAAKIEYEYYLRKERMKEEQRALREQMKQEAEERKRLEEDRKKIEKEEAKYEAEMEKVRAQMASADAKKSELLNNRIAELEKLLSQVNEKKETITKLQNGKAGCVYIISNLGAFGDHVFKIGMTRRMEPQERIDELGSASVPFSFDVHSFIFSQDAPALETAIHHRLNDKRVNKVNLRKEFFDVTLDELEALVFELEPSAEFNRTMAAEQYRQSLSMNEIFTDFETETDEEE